jgi:DNA repair protein RadC
MSQDTFKELYVRGELGATRQASLDEILTAARSIMSRKVRRGTSMSSPKLVKDFLTTKLGTLEHETFCVILLDLCGAAAYAKSLLYSAAFA